MQAQAKKRRFAKIILIIILSVLASGHALRRTPEAIGYDYTTGTSLWDIAERYCPQTMDKRKYIAEITELNAMKDSTVYAGRLYRVPIYEK